MRFLLLLVGTTFFLAACGMKGSLYLPTESVKTPVKVPTIQPTIPLPTHQ